MTIKWKYADIDYLWGLLNCPHCKKEFLLEIKNNKWKIQKGLIKRLNSNSKSGRRFFSGSYSQQRYWSP